MLRGAYSSASGRNPSIFRGTYSSIASKQRGPAPELKGPPVSIKGARIHRGVNLKVGKGTVLSVPPPVILIIFC
jgi:hypothetical protein